MSNFADMAYDNYLMHYRTKGSKNGYTKDPDYTPVGEKAVAKKVMRDKIDRLAEENKKKRAEMEKFNYWPGGDYAGMPSSVREIKDRRWLDESRGRIDDRYIEITKLSNQKYRGDYAGMPSSAKEAPEKARKAQEKAARAYEINRLSKQANKGDYAGMPSSALAAKERNAEIKKLHGQANRGDLGGMPSSAREAKENANRASEISRLRTQRLRGDYAGMPSSVLDAQAKAKRAAEINKLSEQASRGDRLGMPSSAKEAQERAARASEISRLRTQRLRGDYAGMPSSALRAKEITERASIERANAERRNTVNRMKADAESKRKRETMKAKAESKRKREYDPSALAENEERRKLLDELRSKQKRPETNKFRAKEMQAEAEAKRLNSSYEKLKREKAASENRDRELLLAENRRRQRIDKSEKKRAEELERDKAERAERDNRVKDWEDIVSLNKSNSALRSSNGYESRLMKEKKRVSVSGLTGKSPKDLRKKKRDELLKQYGLTPFSNGKWRKV